PAADHERELAAEIVDFPDLASEARDAHGIEAEPVLAGEGLARELQQDAAVAESRLGLRVIRAHVVPRTRDASGPFAELKSREAPDVDVLAELGDRRGDDVLNGLLGLADEGLIEEADLRQELVDLPVDDLVDDLLGLARSERLRAID